MQFFTGHPACLEAKKSGEAKTKFNAEEMLLIATRQFDTRAII